MRRSVVAEALRDGRRARLLRSNALVNAAVVGFILAAAVGALYLDRADAAYGAGATSCDDLEVAATGLRATTHALAAVGLAAAALPILSARGGIVGALKADATGTLAVFACGLLAAAGVVLAAFGGAAPRDAFAFYRFALYGGCLAPLLLSASAAAVDAFARSRRGRALRASLSGSKLRQKDDAPGVELKSPGGAEARRGDLDDILRDASTAELFAKFLAQQYCLENLVFWRLVAALPPGDAVGFGDADRIFGEFLDPRTATLQVNVPASMVARVRDALAASSKGRAVPREPIAACARECRHLMETDSLPRFKKWGPYVAFLDDGVARAAGPGIGDEWAELLAVYDGEPAAFATENPLQEAASTRPSDASKRLGEQRKSPSPAHRDARRTSDWASASSVAARPSSTPRAAPAKVEPPRRTSQEWILPPPDA